MSRRPVNFADLVKKVHAPTVGQDRLSIWGGECSEGQVLTLLVSWPNSDLMPYRLWEYSSKITFEQDTLPDSAQWLERGRLFGEKGGDLSTRRDGNRFRWRFVGPAGACPPDGFDAKDFWRTEPKAQFHENKETALLWGEWKEGFDLWFEDRTARAELQYPLEQTGRVQVKYQTFSRTGRVEFVWLLGLEAYDG